MRAEDTSIDHSGGILRGIAGSPGVISGKAYVVHTLEDALAVEQMDILVTPRVAPEWLDVLMQCVAVVTDRGGATSHPATLCRMLGKPAVVGSAESTTMIHTGDEIEVDGDRGVVTILERVR